ncbi:MAG: sorbosone dehydrogenase family protein [Candidatus Accumulibacter meliphilus]|jgi:glucose/arabinose dehydrogenase|uniref:Sorbosone dehydrogenase family protein n=1 Tax=Candidatus Accumulibacter meliphilus TaxID=2211374 RepID=A0A369XUA5_9PROT|nr:MAG: sorbosone dehydrogenase family protein [Candidatus Accumulibacter meliphilus]
MRRIDICFGLALAVLPLALAADELPLQRIQLPPGFSIETWARVDNARQMALGRHDERGGTLFVGSMQAGKVHALSFGADYQVQGVRLIASGLQRPVGVAYKDGSLYVSAVNRILRYDHVEQGRQDPARPPEAVLVTDRLPTETHHGWKFIAFGPDGKLYVPVGAPCNICEPDPRRYANILRMNDDGSGWETVVRGVRNSVGFDWQPQTGDLWFTDNGRDLLGDDLPPDELNHVARAGMHFGYPYCHGGDLPDPEFGARRRCDEFVAPAQKLAPHAAALGMRFYTGTMFPAQYHQQIFIAEHGSWNRSRKIGYRVTLVRLRGEQAIAYETFASGWLDAEDGESVWGRPSDVLVLPDGSLLVADDYAGAIYRISYRR